jgi:hypothetical protein
VRLDEQRSGQDAAVVIAAEQVLVGLTLDAQRRLACELTIVIAPYQCIARSVVDPDWFTDDFGAAVPSQAACRDRSDSGSLPRSRLT